MAGFNALRVAGVVLLGTALFAVPARADKIEQAGTDVAIAMPVIAGGITLAHDWDWSGAAQLTVDTGLTVGTALILKHLVHERRPDHSDFQSFPSDTAALAFAPAAYLWDRYGWQYGVPAYAAAAFVGYSRVEAKQHHWWDVAASAGIAMTYSHFVTARWRGDQFTSDVYTTPNGAYFKMSYRY
jgi:membrane-associated phospholipid phosphatase